MEIPVYEEHHRIALWGPTSSGKTWFVKSFARKLLDYHDDPDFTYQLLDERDNPVDPSPPDSIQGTLNLLDHVWKFRRIGKKDSLNHHVSSHQHIINVHDDKGANVTELKNVPSVFNLANANFLLLMLDPTRLTTLSGGIHMPHREEINDVADDDGNVIEGGNYAMEPYEYAALVRGLYNLLAKEKHSKRHVAVCITKIDQLPVKLRDPWELIQMFFEKDMYDTLRLMQNNPEIALQTFSISSMGYIAEDENKPNYSSVKNNLARPNSWRPYNVEAPLFWLFDAIERQALNADSSGFWGRLLFQSERSKSYIPYKIRRR